MKKNLYAIGFLLSCAGPLFAQQNPAVINPTMNPAPLANIGSEFDVSMQVGNNGTVAITGNGPMDQMTFTISLGKCAPSFNGSVSAIGVNALTGPAMNYFDVVYDAGLNTFIGTQKSNVSLATVPSGMYSLTVHLEVTALSASSTTNDIGLTFNVQPNASAGGQPTGDDKVEMFTHTTGTTLPVVLEDWSVQARGCNMILSWSTGTELNFNRFEIERSADNKNYILAGNVAASGSNSTYTFTDGKPLAGINIYRLRMVDADGTARYSDHVSSRADCAEQQSVAVYPNPASDVVRISGLTAGNTLRLLDMTGRMLKEKTNVAAAEMLDLTGLAPALYTLQVLENGNVRASLKVSKQ